MSGMGRVLKIVAVGDGAVGKTSMLVAYTQGAFDSSYVPTVFENYAGNLDVDDKKYNFTLWDTAGQEVYDRCRVLCYTGASVFLVCFSVDNRTSFNNIQHLWVPEVRKECGEGVPTVLVGTKTDLRESVDPSLSVKKSEGKKLAKSLKMSAYVECSAKDMTGLQEVFLEAVKAADPPPRNTFRCVIM